MPWRAATSGLPATHSGGCGRCAGFGHDVAARHREELAVVARVRRHRHHVADLLDGLEVGRPLGVDVDAEALQLHPRRALAGAELDPSARHLVERADALGDARRVGEAGRRADDAVADADVARSVPPPRPARPPGADDRAWSSRKWCSTAHMWWMPEAVGQLDVLERLPEHPGLVAVAVRGGQLHLVEHAELHRPTVGTGSGAATRRRHHGATLRNVELVSERSWCFGAPPDVVWAALAATGDYPTWWPWLTAFDADGLVAGGRWRCTVRPPLPYSVRFALDLERGRAAAPRDRARVRRHHGTRPHRHHRRRRPLRGPTGLGARPDATFDCLARRRRRTDRPPQPRLGARHGRSPVRGSRRPRLTVTAVG